jgi:hypothetical protein
MHGKGRHGGRRAAKSGSLVRVLVAVASGRKLAALVVALIAMSVMAAMAMRRMLGEGESPRLEGGDATSIVSPDLPPDLPG